MGTQHTITHGALDHAELAALGIVPEHIHDFSSNLNPFGPPAGVRAALAALDPAPYPDRSCYQLRHALAVRHTCATDEILIGNGSNEIIHLIARALLRPGDVVLVVEPTFGEYVRASELAGGHIRTWRAADTQHFQIDLSTLCDVVRQHRPALIWLCTPNNPTGVAVSAPDLALLAAACAEVGGWLVLDRAYVALERHADSVHEPLDRPRAPHMLQLHSLTKSYALAGLRLGYLLADAALIRRIAPYKPTWSVSSAAQAAGLAALADPGFLGAAIPRLWQSSDALRADLLTLDLPVWRDQLPFMLVQVADAAATRAALLQRGCLVRDCASFGLPTYVRVAPRQCEDNARLLAAWKELLCQHPS